MSTVYLNGEFLPAAEARISPDDRGFLLADGVYEVTPAYAGRFFRLERHLARLARSLRALRIEVDLDPIGGVHRRLIAENGLSDAESAYVYLQVTRGSAPRRHGFPLDAVEPTVYGFASAFRRPPLDEWVRGVRAITAPDRRWARVDVKTVALLPNVLAQQAAEDAGASEVVLVKDGVALESARGNLFFVFDGRVVTHPTTNEILHGITRESVLELARSGGRSVHERAVLVEEIPEADEIFFTGTTSEILPCTELDGRPVGDGTAGPVTRELYDAFREAVGAPVASLQPESGRG